MNNAINRAQYSRFKETENKQFAQRMKKMRLEHKRTFNKEAKRQESMLQRLKKDFDVKTKGLQNKLEQQLVKVRTDQARKVQEENTRLNEELENLKKAHADKINEIKVGQENQVNQLKESHARTLENARNKFIKEKTKWEVDA